MNRAKWSRRPQTWRLVPVFLLMPVFLSSFEISASAQPVAMLGAAPAETSLDATQVAGRRVFEQHCGLCHDHSTPNMMVRRGVSVPGPQLYGDLFKGSEAAFHEFIGNGVPRQMPGFKYSLSPAEIDAVIAYLETLPPPPDNASQSGAPTGGVME